jgi:hypothetical protein
LGFSCNKLVRIGSFHRTEEIRRRIGLGANQKLGGKLLLRKGGEKSEVKIEKVVPNEAYGGGIYLSSLILICH